MPPLVPRASLPVGGGPAGRRWRPAGSVLIALGSCLALAGIAQAAAASTASAAVSTATAAVGTATTAPRTATTAGPAYWVSQSSVSSADTSCKTAAYSTVQLAVTAAEALERGNHPRAVPTIEICPGTYSEQVTITKSLHLARAKVRSSAGPVIIELPAAVGDDVSAGLSSTNCQADDAATGTQLPQSVVEVCAAGPGGANTTGVSVSVSHVTLEGNWQFEDSCAVQMYGLLVGGGASVALADSVVEQIGDFPLQGCQSGVGVEAGDSVTGQVGHVTLTSDTIETYQKNGVTIDGPGSTGKITGITVTGSGPTPTIAQNGIQISFGATGSVTGSTITGNNYTGTPQEEGYYPTYATGILVYGGGGKVCGIGASSPLVRKASLTGNTLTNNDVGIQLFNVNSRCTKSVRTPTADVACHNAIRNTHGYADGTASADANIAGYETAKKVFIGYQAGVADSGDRDVICDNQVSGIGYARRDATSTLPNPRPPAFVRPIDVFSFAPPSHVDVYGNSYDAKAYKPHSVHASQSQVRQAPVMRVTAARS
jgi:hypothetical protein